MFARIAAIGALALLMTVPAAQAAPAPEMPFSCAMPYQAAPYNGPVAQLQTGLDNIAACTYHTHDAPAVPLRVLFVPYFPLPTPGVDQPSADAVLAIFEPQTMPGAVGPTKDCQVQTTCVDLFEIMGTPLVCAQVYPYSLMCSVPNTATQFAITLLKA